MYQKNNIEIIISAEIIPYRYVIIDANDGRVVDNAQGWGFRTLDTAEAYANAHGWIVTNSNTSKSQSNVLF